MEVLRRSKAGEGDSLLFLYGVERDETKRITMRESQVVCNTNQGRSCCVRDAERSRICSDLRERPGKARRGKVRASRLR